MKELKVTFINCYGIKRLSHSFSFSEKHPSVIIYSQNGSMKSSFAKTFKVLSENNIPCDEVFKDRITEYEIISDGKIFNPENVFVVEPFDEKFTSTKVSTLLVNTRLKKEYDQLLNEIESKKNDIEKRLSKYTGFKKDNITLLCNTFNKQEKEFYDLSESLLNYIGNKENKFEYSDIIYKEVINDSAKKFLENEEFQKNITDYINQYDQLIEKSRFFKKGIFNNNNASDVSKNLKDNGFFAANHSVLLKTKNEEIKVSEQKDFEKILEEEKNNILNDKKLRELFDKIDIALNKNKDLRAFKDYTDIHPQIIKELKDVEKFSKNLWYSYIDKESEIFKILLDTYKEAKQQIQKIVEASQKERTEWQYVVEQFNKKFFVPFIVSIVNQDDVILRNSLPNIFYEYVDGAKKEPIEKDKLQKILSMGEKKALYILQLMFEIEARNKSNIPFLVIFDDIADSFDYKNKYAIIEYLNEINENTNINSILLTHNFDFFRSARGRLDIPRAQSFMTYKDIDKISLHQAEYLQDVFVKWREQICTNEKIAIAAIPFLRNIIEYTKGTCCDEYNKLTEMLHLKNNTKKYTVNDLYGLYKDNLNITLKNSDGSNLWNKIFEVSENCLLEDPNSIDLESKIVLSISIRLMAEEIILKTYGTYIDTNLITKDQAIELIKLYKKKFGDDDNMKIFTRVSLMTPENIHLNSFMYEPLIDISRNHLLDLYKDLKSVYSSI